MQSPFHRDGISPIPSSLKLSDSGQIPIYILVSCTMRYYSKAVYKQWGEWKCAICFYCNFKQHALIYPYPRCQLLCLIQETRIRSQNLVWNQPLKKFDTPRSPKNGLCGVVVEDQEKQIQPRVSEQLNVPPPPIPVLRTLRNHAYRFVPVHFLSWHGTDMLIQCYE